MPPPNSVAIGTWWGAVAVLGFSVSLPATSIAVDELDSTFVGLGRAVVAALLATAVLTLARAPIPARRLWPRLAVVAGGIVIGFPLLTAIALRDLPSAHAAVIVGLLPTATALVAVLRGNERPPPLFWLGALLGLAAVLTFATTTGGGGFGQADILTLIAVAVCAVGYGEGAKLANQIGSWQVVCWALVLASPLTITATATSAARHGLTDDTSAWLAFAYLGTVSMFLGFFAWYRGLAAGGVARISQLQLAQPLLTFIWSAVLVGEQVATTTILAGLVVVLSIATTQRARISRTERRVAGEQPR